MAEQYFRLRVHRPKEPIRSEDRWPKVLPSVFEEPAEASDMAEEWLKQFGKDGESFVDLLFNGDTEPHSSIFRLKTHSTGEVQFGIWNRDNVPWPITYMDDHLGVGMNSHPHFMATGYDDPPPPPAPEADEGAHKKGEADKMKIDGEDDGDEEGWDDDPEADAESDGESEDWPDDQEDEEDAEDAEDGPESHTDDDEGEDDYEADDEDEDDGEGEGPEPEEPDDDEEDEDDSESEEGGEDPDEDDDFTGDENDEEDEGDDADEGEDERDSQGEDGEDGEGEEDGPDDDDAEDENDEEEEVMPRLPIFAKMRGPKGWRKRADAEDLNERNTFGLKIGVLDPDGETSGKQEKNVRCEIVFVEDEQERKSGLLQIKLPPGVVIAQHPKNGKWFAQVPYYDE